MRWLSFEILSRIKIRQMTTHIHPDCPKQFTRQICPKQFPCFKSSKSVQLLFDSNTKSPVKHTEWHRWCRRLGEDTAPCSFCFEVGISLMQVFYNLLLSKNERKKKKSLSKQNHNSHTFLNSDYISTLRHSLFNNNSKILVLAQKLYLYSLAGVKDQMVHDGWGEGVQ